MSIFEQLDDEAGIAPDPERKHRIKNRAQALRNRQRILVVTLLLLAPLSTLAVLVTDDDGAPVRVATDATLPTVPPMPRPEDPPPPPTASTATPTTSTAHPDAGYELGTVLEESGGSGVSGHAGAGRRGSTTWDVFVKVQRLVPVRRYSVLVRRAEPDHGTPFPTACSLVATEDGFGVCNGRIESEGGPPTNIGLMDGETGRAVAHGYFR